MSYHIDEYGRAVVNSNGLFELWYQGLDEHGLVIDFDEELIRFNKECSRHSRDAFAIARNESAPEPHSVRAKRWMIPAEYEALDVEELCLALCSSDEQRTRVRHEMKLYREHDMLPVLRTLVYMIEMFRENKVVWGLGRGSSVASYVLYLIGVHKIDPLRYGLDVEDFLR